MRIDGKLIAQQILENLRKKVTFFRLRPTLAVIQVGDNPASISYIRQKQKAAEFIGARLIVKQFNNLTMKQFDNETIIKLIGELNKDKKIHGIIVQLPLPESFAPKKILAHIIPQKDVDGFTPNSPFTPPVAMAVLKVLEEIKKLKDTSDGGRMPSSEVDGNRWRNSKFLVIGRGLTAGKPIAKTLKKLGYKVSIAHSKTKLGKFGKLVKSADVVVSCVGKPDVIRANMLKPGAIVIGVGIHREPDHPQGEKPATGGGDTSKVNVLMKKKLARSPAFIPQLLVASAPSTSPALWKIWSGQRSNFLNLNPCLLTGRSLESRNIKNFERCIIKTRNMVDANPPEEEIKINFGPTSVRRGDKWVVPKPSWRERLATWLDARKVVVLNQSQLKNGPAHTELLQQIHLGEPLQPNELEFLKKNLEAQIRLHPEQADYAATVFVSAELNQSATASYVSELRRVTPSLIKPYHTQYTNGEWYQIQDLTQLADRWQLPVLIIWKGGVHYVLALREPEFINNQWRVLIYDPYKNYEEWLNLKEWDTNYSDPKNSISLFASRLGQEQLRAHSYNLSLQGDNELANRAQIYEAKQTYLQPRFNVEDCGPICLFAAALRQGIKPGWNEFKFAGKEALERDTLVHIYTREELFG